jgi:hypothetical protein
MASTKPWQQVVTPRKDLRDGKPLDASEFAIHLNQVVRGVAPDDYKDPKRFFERTYLTRGLREVAVEVIRRLSGETVGASPVINLTTPFGGGKTHALALLYHLFNAGPLSHSWPGVTDLLSAARVSEIPKAVVATFVGTEFDPVVGSTGPDEPTRFTPWGDLAWQIGGKEAFDFVAEQDRARVRPGGETLRRVLPPDRPVLILMDEVLNFLNAARAIKAGDTTTKHSTMASQFLSFLQALTEMASGQTGLELVMALPRSEMEMTADDQADYGRLQKLSSRVDKPYILSEGLEAAEIIRRRLFENLGSEADRRATIRAYVKALVEDRELLAPWFPLDRASDLLEASYPFHPTVLSVFERKWQTLPSFQRTRGVLKMLALWVSQTFMTAYREGRKEPLITLGMAPLDDTHFRAAVLEQLGESRLEAPITTDIAGAQAHAVLLDGGHSGPWQTANVHRAVASAIFFESTGGQVKEEASLPEIRLALGGPDFELGHLETALTELLDASYYLRAEGARYHFSLRENLNKRLADLRAGLEGPKVDARARDEVQAVFKTGGALERRFFPERSGDIPNAPALTLIVMNPVQSLSNGEREKTSNFINGLIADAGSSSRVFKSALFFAVPESAARLNEAARSLLAWDGLEKEAQGKHFDDAQRKEIAEQRLKSKRELSETVWSTYHTVAYLGPEGNLEELDLGLLHSSAGETLTGYIELRLRQQDILVPEVSTDFLVRHWPPALPQWPLRSLRDAFFSSPKLPRLSNGSSLRATIARGVRESKFGLGHLDGHGGVAGVRFAEEVADADVDFGEDVVLVSAEEAELAKKGVNGASTTTTQVVDAEPESHSSQQTAATKGRVRRLEWRGELPHGKWMTFYSKVLTKLVLAGGVRVNIQITSEPPTGLTPTQVNDVRQALTDLDLPPAEVDSAKRA